MFTEKDILESFSNLKETFPAFDGIVLKNEQVKVTTYILNQHHCMGILPTGFGKTLCYTIAPLILDKVGTRIYFSVCVGGGGGDWYWKAPRSSPRTLSAFFSTGLLFFFKEYKSLWCVGAITK